MTPAQIHALLEEAKPKPARQEEGTELDALMFARGQMAASD